MVGTYSMDAFSVARFTDAAITPSSPLIAFSTELTQAAQVMSLIATSSLRVATPYPSSLIAAMMTGKRTGTSDSENSIVARSSGRLTAALLMPSIFFSERSTAEEQAAQVIPVTGMSIFFGINNSID